MRVRQTGSNPTSASVTPDTAGTVFAGLLGLFLGISLLKFGNPIILDRLVEMPRTLDEWRVFSWPVRIGHLLLVGVALAAIPILLRRPRLPSAVSPRFLLPLGLWMVWQLCAGVTAIDSVLSRGVLGHFLACLACFALGYWALARIEEPRIVWICLAGAFLGVLGLACEQRFGGLQATRAMILQQADSASLPPEYLARIQSNRVFGPFVYPNALAGAILLLGPLMVRLCWKAGLARWGPRAAFGAGGLMLLASVSVLVWSGSKAGWLLAMVVGLILLFDSSLPRRFKLGLAGSLIFVGLATFAVLYSEKLSRGATSVAARFDYWSAAWTGFLERPLMGHGPGCFKHVYLRLKRPESEMAQLTHNDYLQQAVDSGLPGLVTYLGFVVVSLTRLYRHSRRDKGSLVYAVWLGLTAWALHGLVEFGLYIPATSWCAFTLWGWALGCRPATTNGSLRTMDGL